MPDERTELPAVRLVTYEGYETLLRLHALPRIGRLRLEQLRPLEIQELSGKLLAGGGG